MTGVSGFTFIHNALIAGYPLFEAMSMVLPYVTDMVVVDMESNDGTRELLDRVARSSMGHITIVDGVWWPGKAGKCLSYNHSLHDQYCKQDLIWHFEADEVFSGDLMQHAIEAIRSGYTDLSVPRLQIEQNFQRVRWYPEWVHRIFPKGSCAKSGHTTTRHPHATELPVDAGYLWDVTNCFRDNWEARIKQQAELWGGEPNYIYVPLHAKHENTLNPSAVDEFLAQPQWFWRSSPFILPNVLRAHVGKTKYEPRLDWFEFRIED